MSALDFEETPDERRAAQRESAEVFTLIGAVELISRVGVSEFLARVQCTAKHPDTKNKIGRVLAFARMWKD